MTFLGTLNFPHLVERSATNEVFKFGDDGRSPAYWRYKIPSMCFGKPVFIWVSVVDVKGLRLLLGKDYLRGLGCRIDFFKDLFDSWRSGLRSKPLMELKQGHCRMGLHDTKFEIPAGVTTKL